MLSSSPAFPPLPDFPNLFDKKFLPLPAVTHLEQLADLGHGEGGSGASAETNDHATLDILDSLQRVDARVTARARRMALTGRKQNDRQHRAIRVGGKKGDFPEFDNNGSTIRI